jgi:hypothetical protein
MGKILVKAPQAVMDTSGNMQFLYGGDKGSDRGSLPARLLGGAGKFAGAALGATGPHQSLQSLVGGMQGGAAMGEQAGRYVGGLSDKFPGGRTRMARRKIRSQRDDDYAQMAANQRESNPTRMDRAMSKLTPLRNRRDQALDAFNVEEGARAQQQKDQERFDRMYRDAVYRRQIKNLLTPSEGSPMDDAMGTLADKMGVRPAEARRSTQIYAQAQEPPTLAEANKIMDNFSTAGRPMGPVTPMMTNPPVGATIGAGDQVPQGMGDHVPSQPSQPPPPPATPESLAGGIEGLSPQELQRILASANQGGADFPRFDEIDNLLNSPQQGGM